MRTQWLRLLLVRSRASSEPQISQVQRFCSLPSSNIHHRAPHLIPKPFSVIRCFTSSPELAVEPHRNPSDDQGVLLIDIFRKPKKSSDEIKQDLDLKSVEITHDLILSVLANPNLSHDVARRIFNWLLENHSEKLSSKSYNLMLRILGSNGFVKETWEMIENMKKKGYGVSKWAFHRISERFQKDGLSEDVEKLKDLYASGSAGCKERDATRESDKEKFSIRISEIIATEVWNDDVENKLKSFGVEFSGDLVASVLENLEIDPNKALIFFRWVKESGLVKHDLQTYNAMASVLCKEDHLQKFWRIVDEMKTAGYEMEGETYRNISKQFVKRKMIKDAVDLYEFAILGQNKPSVQNGTLLLKKIVASKELDMGLFSKVVQAFKAGGNELTGAQFKAVIKYLIRGGKTKECNSVLAAMKEAGYQPSASVQRMIAFILGHGGKAEAALGFVDNTMSSQHISDYEAWVSLVKGFCRKGDLDEAANGIRKMVEKEEGIFHAKRALDLLVGSYCKKNKPIDAYRFVVDMLYDKGLSPCCATYKKLTRKLLAKMHFNEALYLMSVMKKQGYSPDLVSFLGYLSSTGNADDARTFLQVLNSKGCASASVYVQLFEAYFKAGRLTDAQDFLSRCPNRIKNHADILNLFSSQQFDSTNTKAVAV